VNKQEECSLDELNMLGNQVYRYERFIAEQKDAIGCIGAYKRWVVFLCL
jgi:hypothetical protein